MVCEILFEFFLPVVKNEMFEILPPLFRRDRDYQKGGGLYQNFKYI